MGQISIKIFNEFGGVLKDANKNELIDNFRYTNEHNNAVKNYFMVLYQLLKFIDIQCIKNNFDAKFFTNMVRAILDRLLHHSHPFLINGPSYRMKDLLPKTKKKQNLENKNNEI